MGYSWNDMIFYQNFVSTYTSVPLKQQEYLEWANGDFKFL